MNSVFFKKLGLFLSISILLLTLLNPQFAFAVNYALSFNGLNQYVSVSPTVSWSDTAPITIEAWIKTTESKPQNNILSWSDGNTHVIEFRTYNGKFELIKSGTPTHVISSASVNTGNWVHVAAVKDGSNQVTLYINGIADGTATLHTDNAAMNLFYIGVMNFSGTVDSATHFNGQIDEVRIWNVARTQAEIQTTMNYPLVGNESGLVAYYNFDQTSGTNLPDLAGGDHNGTLQSFTGTEWTTSGAPLAPGNALSFNGSNSYVQTNEVNLGTSPFTFEGWVKPNGTSGCIYNNRTSEMGSAGNWFSLSLSNNNKLGIELADGGVGGYTAPAGNISLAPGVWHHIAVVKNATHVTFYVDGVLDAQIPDTFARNLTGLGAMTMGVRNNALSPFNGQIDEFRVWKTALSPTQIQANMHNVLVGNEANLEAYYKFDLTTGSVLPDITGRGHNGTLINSPSWQPSGAMAPFPISASDVTTTGFTANWNAVSSATGYRIDIFDAALNPIGLNISAGSGTTFNVTGLTLTPGTTYYFLMRAEKGAWTSPNSTAVSFMLPPGNALQFSGSNHVDVGTGINLVNQSFTVEFWAKRNPSTVYQMAISQGTASSDHALALGFISSNQFDFSFWGDDLVTTTAYTESDWHHWAGVYDTSIATGINRWLYRDGILVASDRAAGNYQGSGNFYIGITSYTGDHFPGEIDEVRIWNVARTQAEIQSKMYHTLAGNESGLITYYNFDQAIGSTTLPDLTVNARNGSLVGAPTWTAATWNYGFPYVTTGTASAIHGTTASVGGTLVDPGVSTVTASGICYATTTSPTIPCTNDGATTATTAFTSNLTSLTPNGTPYYARAYATNFNGTNYGTPSSTDVTFTTHYIPVIAQTSPLSVTMSQNSTPTGWVTPTITASDTENDTLTWSVNTQATHGTATISGNGASPTTFTYSPNSDFTGSDSFIVQVADVDGSATITVNVTITPTPPTYPMATTLPALGQTIQFDTLVGQVQTLPLILKNFGSAVLFFNGINTPVAPFNYPKPLPFTFIPYGDASGSPQTLELSCAPTEIGLKTMTLQITTNDPAAPTLSYTLECVGRQPIALSSVANNTPLNFGSALINNTLTQTITFSENGNADLILNSATITGANADQFHITAPATFPITIAEGSTTSQAVTVTCTPTTATVLNATLQIAINDPLNPTLTYPLQCSGLYSLALSTSGQGTIAGCGSSCTQNHPQDANVTLSVTPATGWQFSSWGGDCANGQVTMTGNKSCSANFIQTVTNPTDPSNGSGTGSTTSPGDTGGSTTPPPSNNGGTSTGGSTTSPNSGTGGGTTAPTDSGSSDLNNSVVAVVPTSNASVDTAMSNYNQTATNLTVLPNGSVSGGTLAGEVTNQGLIANITIAPNTTVTGGKLSGFNTNSGLLSDVTISQYSQVQGGNYAGNILNKGTLNNPILSPSSTVINSGVIENPVILPGANISGGTLVGTIIVLGTFDSVSIPPSATVITQVSKIPTAIFKQVTAQTLALLPPSVISQISPEQFAEIPVSSLSGLTAQNMIAISPQVVQSLDAKQIAALNPEEFKTMPGDGVAKFLTNFDTAAITPQEAEKLLPARWTIDSNGNLTAPPGTAIAFKVLEQNNLPKGLRLPNLTDLNSSFALGGNGSHPLLNQLNQGVATEGGAVTQQKSGVVQTEVAGTVSNGRKSQFAFMIDPEHIFILDENALRGLQINEQGQYIVVTEDGKQIPITPMTKDPEALLTVLGENAEVDIQQTGEVLIKHIPIKRTRDGEEIHSVGIFDPFIEPAPEDICTPEGICDWDQADASMQPGLRSARNLRAQSAAKVTYPDGTSQKIYPAVLFPDILVAEAKKFAGVEKAIFRVDGIVAVTYQGMKLWLIPTFDVHVQPIPVGRKFPPSLTLEKESLIYQVPYGDNLVTTTLSIIEAPSIL